MMVPKDPRDADLRLQGGGRVTPDRQCPLCGRRMTAIETYPGRGELYCGRCDLTIGGNEAKTPEELMVLLNQTNRAESEQQDELRRVMATFEWHLMADEMPEKERGDYIVMGVKGGLYLAPRFVMYGNRVWFKDAHGNHHYPDQVKAWAEIPPLETSE